MFASANASDAPAVVDAEGKREGGLQQRQQVVALQDLAQLETDAGHALEHGIGHFGRSRNRSTARRVRLIDVTSIGTGLADRRGSAHHAKSHRFIADR